jgi:endonuclease/exonuclease/phosphatase family metal-dependent hydrolase
MLPMLGTALLGLAGWAGCRPEGEFSLESAPAFRDPTQVVSNDRPTRYVSAGTTHRNVPIRAQETILVASFNIQAFGETKMNDRWVMERLAEVIRRFDVVAIQEIRSKDQGLIPALLNYVNATGERYDFLLGPRLGDTVSKEQYAYVYDTSRLISGQNCSYTLNDDINLLHREPLIGRFVVRTSRTNTPWTFSLVNLHTDPDVADREVDAMAGIMREIRNFELSSAQEDDVILLGDFNAGPQKFGKIQTQAGLIPLISNQPTNVRGSEIYDNLLIDPSTNAEYTGHAGVLSLTDYFQLSVNEALKLSDHNPVWAEFLVEERAAYAQPQFARQAFDFAR